MTEPTVLPALPRAKELLDGKEAHMALDIDQATAYALVAIAETLTVIHNDLRDLHAVNETVAKGIRGLDAELQAIKGRMR